MNCAMICGSPNIWPMPTTKTSISSHSLTFDTNQIIFNVVTVFPDAKTLLQHAYEVFLFDIKHLEAKPIASNVGNTANNQNDEADTDKEKAHDDVAMNTNKNCDINKLIIKAEILSISDVHQHQNMDESYELNVTSKYILPSRLFCLHSKRAFFIFC